MRGRKNFYLGKTFLLQAIAIEHFRKKKNKLQPKLQTDFKISSQAVKD